MGRLAGTEIVAGKKIDVALMSYQVEQPGDSTMSQSTDNTLIELGKKFDPHRWIRDCYNSDCCGYCCNGSFFALWCLSFLAVIAGAIMFIWGLVIEWALIWGLGLGIGIVGVCVFVIMLCMFAVMVSGR